jgi:hypothetical protein
MHVSILATGPALAMALPATRFPCFHTSPRENSAADTEAELLPWGPAVRQSLNCDLPCSPGTNVRAARKRKTVLELDRLGKGRKSWAVGQWHATMTATRRLYTRMYRRLAAEPLACASDRDRALIVLLASSLALLHEMDMGGRPCEDDMRPVSRTAAVHHPG